MIHDYPTSSTQRIFIFICLKQRMQLNLQSNMPRIFLFLFFLAENHIKLTSHFAKEKILNQKMILNWNQLFFFFNFV